MDGTTARHTHRSDSRSASELIGSSPSFHRVREDVDVVAPVDCAVLLRGETGTGKEAVARAIHQASPRRSQPFVALNCAAMPGGLIESELFGHERGAFTGAATQTVGRFQAAHRGTLLLDEIGDLPLELQPKLLRVLQEQRFERLGGSQSLQVNVRVIAATNQDLAQMVRERKFRADLFYRLNVFPIVLPPLRERIEDIPLLVTHFVRQNAEKQGKEIDCIPDDVMERMVRYHWPGNIRELQNWVERAVIMSPGPELRLPFDMLEDDTPPSSRPEPRTLEEANREHILETLRQVRGVIGGRHGAAARLGMPRTTLISRMHKLGIENPSHKGTHRELCPAETSHTAAGGM